MGAKCIFVGLVGSDEAGAALGAALDKLSGIVTELVTDKTAADDAQGALRLRASFDPFAARRLGDRGAARVGSQTAIIARAEAAIAKAAAVVLSDYAKGVLTARVIRAIIETARRLGKPVVVDPKHHDYRVYRGATLITPNAKELAAAVHRPITTEAEIAAAAAELARVVESEAVLVKRSEHGMSLHVEGHAPIHVPAYPVKVRDVSGAGDTVAAVMAVMLAMRTPYEFAMRAANAAAAVVVGKRGTSTVSLGELRHRILPAASLAPEDKILFDWSQLDERLAEWRRQALRIGFTNGCFDLLHRGHVRLLAEARAACDRLVVGSTAMLRPRGSKARVARSIRRKAAPKCWPRSRRSIWSWCSMRTRRWN